MDITNTNAKVIFGGRECMLWVGWDEGDTKSKIFLEILPSDDDWDCFGLKETK